MRQRAVRFERKARGTAAEPQETYAYREHTSELSTAGVKAKRQSELTEPFLVAANVNSSAHAHRSFSDGDSWLSTGTTATDTQPGAASQYEQDDAHSAQIRAPSGRATPAAAAPSSTISGLYSSSPAPASASAAHIAAFGTSAQSISASRSSTLASRQSISKAAAEEHHSPSPHTGSSDVSLHSV